MKKAGLESENDTKKKIVFKSGRKFVGYIFNVIQAVSLPVFLGMGLILLMTAGRYGAGIDGVKDEIKNRIQALGKEAKKYVTLTVSKDAYENMGDGEALENLGYYKEKFSKANTNFNFGCEIWGDDGEIIDTIYGYSQDTNVDYDVRGDGTSYYYKESDEVLFNFDKKKLYNDAIDTFCLNTEGYSLSKKEKIISQLKKLYPYDRMYLNGHVYSGALVCSVSFDGVYADREYKKLKKQGDVYVKDQWAEAIFSTGEDNNLFYGEFRNVILNRLSGEKICDGTLKFGDCHFFEDHESFKVKTRTYVKRDVVYSMYSSICKKLKPVDGFYYLDWYIKNYNIITFLTYFSGILFLISSIALIKLSETELNAKGKTKNIYKIPMDVIAGIICVILSICLNILMEVDNYNLKSLMRYGIENVIIMLLPIGVLAGLFFTMFFTSFCAQVKDGSIISNALFKKFILLIVRIIKMLLSTIRTSILVFAIYWGISVIESLLLLDSELRFLLFIFIKIIGTFIIAKVLKDISKIQTGVRLMAAGSLDGKIDTDKMIVPIKKEAEYLNSIGEGMKKAVASQMKSERMKTELITNVSHDIKTPITAIISYVDLLKKEDLKNEKAVGYIDVLDRQSQRLKNLIYDLLDLSKASTGNVEVNMSEIDLSVFVEQSLGEYIPKMEKRNLTPVVNFKMEDEKKNELKVKADGRHLSRVFDNIFQNICKYAMENTRVYIDVELFSTPYGENSESKAKNKVCVSVKNMSEHQLNISGDELTERFVRGDKSRNTEGSGLGLSIAQNLMKLQDGSLDVIIDGDLFKVVITLNQ